MVPIIDSKGLQHELHLFVETATAPATAIFEVIKKVIAQINPEILVIGCNNKVLTNSELNLAWYTYRKFLRTCVRQKAFQERVVLQCLLHMPQLLPNFQAFAVLAVPRQTQPGHV